ncbi:MAG: S8 family serine peptidase, partial [Gammaproteobacteria bacterium]|nr:S8 family serine peptidase [Gammaproteobacteria bacterium]
MRWILWVAFLTLAAGAGAVGVDAEWNPVRTHPHVPAAADAGRIIVKLRPASESSGLARSARVALGRQRIATLAARNAMTLSSVRAITPELHALVLDPAAGQRPAEVLARLRADADVEYAEPDERRYPHAGPVVPNDTLFASLQWYLQQSSATTPSAVDAVTAWETTTGSAAIVIADIDTGVRYEHPDLQWAGQGGGRLLPGVTLITDPFIANENGTTLSTNASDPGDWVTQADASRAECSNLPNPPPTSSSWHGTHVSGLLGAITNNDTGIAGTTWSGWILPVRVLGKCGGQDSDIISAMMWAA